MADNASHSFGEVVVMVLAIAIAFAVAMMIVRTSHQSVRGPHADPTPRALTEPPPLGVRGTLRAGDVAIEREWPTLDFAIQADESLDETLAPGRFEGEFLVTFRPGHVQYAQIGAALQGGSIIIMRDDEVLLSDHSPAGQTKHTLTRVPQWLPRRHEQIVYIFRSDGDGPASLQAIWQPEGQDAPRPLP